MRIVSILARYGTDKYQDAEQQLQEILDRFGPGIERPLIVVDNMLPVDYLERLNSSTTLIGGDNSAWEFSAWDQAIRFLGKTIWSYDLVHLVTSAFHTLYTAYLDRFDRGMLQSIVGMPVCLGHIDCYNDPVSILSFRSQHWMRSSFLFTPPAELKMLKSLVSVANPGDFFSANSPEPFAPQVPLSSNYQKYVFDWLTGGDIGQGSTWHSGFKVNEESLAFFQAKATAIFNEHLLAIRMRAQSTKLIDTTWLATQLKTRPVDEIDWSTSWRRQLAEREVDKVVIPERRDGVFVDAAS